MWFCLELHIFDIQFIIFSILQAESQTIRANELLNRKKEKVNRKYTQTVRRERQLSPGFLEDALDEAGFNFLFSVRTLF